MTEHETTTVPSIPKLPTTAHYFSQKKFLLAVAFLSLLFIIFYAQLLIGRKYLREDYLEQAYPNIRFIADCLRHGYFPFWTPYIFGGTPFASDPQATMFYPPFWIYLLLSLFTEPGGIIYTWYILLHILILGIGMLVLVRGMGMGGSASVLSAVTLMFAGFVSLHVFHTFIYVAAWFPFAFHFYRISLNSHNLRYIVISGLFFGISMLGGYPQYSLHIVYFIGAWTLFSWGRSGVTRYTTMVHVLFFVLFVSIGITLAAVQYLPSFENMEQSIRETMIFKESLQGSIRLSQLITLFVPSFFGMAQPGDPDTVPYWGAQSIWYFWETCIFVGIAPLFLALRAVSDGRKSPPHIFFFATIALLCMLCALGNATPLYTFVFHCIPGFKNFRIPGRFAFLFAVCIAILAGTGLQRLLTSDKTGRIRFFKIASIMAAGIVIPCLLFLTGMLNGDSEFLKLEKNKLGAQNAVIGAIFTTLFVWGAITYASFRPVIRGRGCCAALIVFLELFAFGHKFNETDTDPEKYYGRFDLVPLRDELMSGHCRIQGGLYGGRGVGERLFPRNLGNVAGISFVDGYNQLCLSRWYDLMRNIAENKVKFLFNIRYCKIPGEPRLIRMPPAPWFYLTTHYKVVNDRFDAISHINSEAFIPGRQVVIEKEPCIFIKPDDDLTGQVRLIKKDPNRIEIEATASVNCLFSISEPFYPAWKAMIDGKKTDILAANCAFRAIPLAAGSHRIVMYYQSDTMIQGAIISLFTLTIVVIILFGKKSSLQPVIAVLKPKRST